MEKLLLTTENNKNRKAAIELFIAAGIMFAILLATRLITLFNPLFALVYYGTLVEVLYYIILLVICVVCQTLVYRYFVKHHNLSIFKSQAKPVSSQASLLEQIIKPVAVVGICLITVIIVGASFNFKLKMEFEMGTGVTGAKALTNIAVYFYYGCHIWLMMTVVALVQRGFDILFVTKYSISVGAIVLVLIGAVEFLFEALTTNHMYPHLYFILTFVYAAIWELTRSYHGTFWASVVLMVL